jgi:16S rRNA (adenine1518-N6/adenine1519-N6)-dimethyltransferase
MTFAAHRARKRFGQHWLRDETVLDRILAAAELSAADTVLEVGPGRGALTERLLASPAAAVHAVELDRDLVSGLRLRFGGDPRFTLTEGDVLAVDLPAATAVVANIPYNITGPLLERPWRCPTGAWCCWCSRRWGSAFVLAPAAAPSPP